MPTLSPTDAQIRTAIAITIATAAPLAAVYRWWALGAEPDDWPGMLRSESDLDANSAPRVHGYVITRTGTTAEDAGPRGTKRTAEYTILAFHYYSTGTQSSNSETTFATEIDAVTAALDDKATIDAYLARRTPITWNFDLKSYGGELLHIARGVISITLCY